MTAQEETPGKPESSQKPLKNCAKCGMCLSVCPVYKVLHDERSSPRAKVHMIRSHAADRLESSPLLQELIGKCLMCGSCTSICPLGINHSAEFMEIRRQMVQDHGEKISIKGLVYLLSKEQRLKLATRFARLGQSLAPSILMEKYKLADIPVGKFPVLNSTPLRDALPEVVAAKGEEIGTVIYFTGCASNYIYDDTGLATVRVLSRLGYKVLIPKAQTCCALPPLFHGFQQDAVGSIKANLAALYESAKTEKTGKDRITAIIVDCATCGTALKSEYATLCEELQLDRAAVEYIASKVVNISTFLVRSGALKRLAAAREDAIHDRTESSPQKITYHLPCHLKNSADKESIVEKIAALSPQLTYVQAEDFDSCCGGGGTFFYEYPEIAGQMISEKIAKVKKTGAEILLTDCPVCRMNFAGNLEESDGIRVVHPVAFLDELMRGR